MSAESLRAALAELVELKDSLPGPMDWEIAWDAARTALAQRADEPAAWRSEEDTPPAPGWYAVRRADKSLCLRGFGKDGLWWIPLQDGWLSGIPPGFSWFGPLEPIEWDTPAAPAAPAYVPLSESDALRAELETAHISKKERDRIDAECNALKRFALAMLEHWPLGDVDGGELQEEAVKHGLLVPETRTAVCSEEGCNCAEYYSAEEWAEGITCYRKAAWLKGMAT